MPVIITKESTDYYLVPSPLMSFSRNTYNNVGRAGFGADFAITLQGTLVPHKGNPFYDMSVGSTQPGDAELSTATWTKPSTAGSDASDEPNYGFDANQLLAATIRKQEKIRWLFTNDVESDGVAKPIMVNITNWGETTGGIKFAAFVDSIEFGSDGRGVNPESYTITMRCDNFLDSADSNFGPMQDETKSAYSITSVDESFDIAEGDGTTIEFNGAGIGMSLHAISKTYNISKNTTVVGAPIYDSNGAYQNNGSGAPWSQASGYVYNVLGIGTGVLPTGRHDVWRQFRGEGDRYKIANRVITESIDKEAGSYSISESFLAYSGDPVIHNISVNTDTAENQLISVSVQGTIQGLDTHVDGPFGRKTNAYQNAVAFSTGINETGKYANGDNVIPSAYYIAKSLADVNWLHPMPKSKSLGRDIAGGSISYSYNFDDRPPNLVSGSVSEVINISDTYPGELFSATPVIGRNQPVLQYLNSRSEFKRNLSISIIMGKANDNWDYPDATGGYWAAASQSNIQKWFLDDKPSNIVPSSGDLNTIFQAANPVNDPRFDVRSGKCFHSAPNETWDAYSRTYSYSVEWTYERDV
jgi:hypothetical protein